MTAERKMIYLDDAIATFEGWGLRHPSGMPADDDVVTALRALPAVAPAVKVKPLVWGEAEGKSYQQAKCAIGQYEISWLAEFECWQLFVPHKEGKAWEDNFSRHPHKDAAQAAAQADYDARILAALEPAPAVKVKPPYDFDRYINGIKMAEGVTIERQTDIASACREAARIASKGPNGEAPVLVLAALEPAPADPLGAEWHSIEEALPPIGHPILLYSRGMDGKDRIRTAMLLVRHEGVSPSPSDVGGKVVDWFFDSAYPGTGDMRLARPGMMWAEIPSPHAAPTEANLDAAALEHPKVKALVEAVERRQAAQDFDEFADADDQVEEAIAALRRIGGDA